MITSGTRLGPYEVLVPVGAGGMGEVYRARDTRLDREVAIKILPSHLSSNSARRERFDREARAISRLSHASVCTLFDVGHQDGIDYLVMEYLGGESLADVLARGPLPLDQLLRCGEAVAEALDHAHRNGVVHRDLKPGNIMLTKTGAKVLDFGLAKMMTEGEPEGTEVPTQQKPLTEEGTILGTMQYMAPEQLEAREADARTDIFALGSILYEMATGRHAFEAKSRASLIAAIMDRDPAPISAIQPMTPPALEQIVRRCLAKEPDDRFQSARDLAFALREVRDTLHSGEQPRVQRDVRRTPIYIAVAAVVLAVAGAGAWFYFRHQQVVPASRQSMTVAVLPFANLGIARSREHLRLAIPDEITTLLTYDPQLAIRPFSISRRLVGDVDPQEAAKKLDASAIVSGHLMEEGGRLSVTLEAIDIRANRVIWHDVLDVPSSDPIALRRSLANSVNGGLLPRLAPASAKAKEREGPKNAEAYSLYLRASAASTDEHPNAEALQLLEESVRLDPGYAPAWSALSQRAYWSYTYSTGTETAVARAREAAQRALELDPDLIDAAGSLIIIRTESGDTVNAWRDAKKLLDRRPDSAVAHFLLSYALRYGGDLEAAARECNASLAIDPGNRGLLRSCAFVFMQLGNYDRALDFVRTDEGSEWSRNTTGLIMLGRGSAREALPLVQGPSSRRLVAARLDRKPPAEIDAAAKALRSRPGLGDHIDGEPFYFTAGILSMCDRPADALGLLRDAVRRNYCSYPAVETDPMFAAVRRLPEYLAFRETAKSCHASFMEATR
jgi:TolB-like protein